jgi:hypothetical protein
MAHDDTAGKRPRSRGGPTNGLMRVQVINSGIVPGNRNLDNAAGELEKFEHLAYPNKAVQTAGIKAGLLKSFGFGQAGAEILVRRGVPILSTDTARGLGARVLPLVEGTLHHVSIAFS